MSDWQIVLPHIGPRANLEGCLASMQTVEVPLLIVDNSVAGDTHAMTLPQRAEIESHPRNLGVAASWNRGLARGAHWTLILSASMRFGPGGLTAFVEAASKAANAYGTDCGKFVFHCTVIGRATVERIGRFDENFYPAYFEDNDYWRRMILAGITGCEDAWLPRFAPLPGMHCVGSGMAVQGGFVPMADPTSSRDYFIRKWGGPPACEVFRFPFNDASKDLEWWPPRGEMDA